MHLSRQWTCWSLRCSWSNACRRCSNYIFILDLTPGFTRLGEDNCKTRWESFKCMYLVHLILESLRFVDSVAILGNLRGSTCVEIKSGALSTTRKSERYWKNSTVKACHRSNDLKEKETCKKIKVLMKEFGSIWNSHVKWSVHKK